MKKKSLDSPQAESTMLASRVCSHRYNTLAALNKMEGDLSMLVSAVAAYLRAVDGSDVIGQETATADLRLWLSAIAEDVGLPTQEKHCMAYYIGKDHNVYTYRCVKDGIMLNDGRYLKDGTYSTRRLFAVHPSRNSNMVWDEATGSWLYNGKPLPAGEGTVL